MHNPPDIKAQLRPADPAALLPMDQQLSSAALNLEQVLCRGLGVAPPPSALRNIKLKALKDGTSQRFPEENFSQAVQFLASNAPDRAAFEDHLRRLHVRGVKGYRELAGLLHILATDDLLKVLTKGPFKSSLDVLRGGTQHAHADSLGPAAGAGPVAGARPATRRTPGAEAGLPAPSAPPQGLQPTASARGLASAQPLAGDGRGSSSGGTQPLAPVHSSASATATPAAAAMGRGGPGAPGPFRNSGYAGTAVPQQQVQHLAQPPAIGLQAYAPPQQQRDAPPAQPHTLTHNATSAASASNAQFNPIYGQEDASTPMPRLREYKPAITTSMAAARVRAGPLPPSTPSIVSTGDLFVATPPSPFAKPPSSSTIHDALATLPAWNASRPHLTLLDLVEAAAANTASAAAQADADALAGLPQGAQDVAVMNDLLYAFMGLDGQHLRATLAPTSRESSDAPGDLPGPCLSFRLTTHLTPCAQELVQRLLPICEHVVILQRFIETRSGYGHGLVAQAVAAALHHLLCDWQLVVTQLEHQLRTGRLTLQGLQFYCQAPAASLSLLASVAAAAAAKRLSAASLLNLLASRAAGLAGDPGGQALLHRLLQAAAAPYFRMLERWLLEGVLDDPYGEFMVQEDTAVGKDALGPDRRLAYWSQRYTIRQRPTTTAATEPDVPTFLLGLVDKILTTGKYLNAIRECGQPVPKGAGPDIRVIYDPHGAYVPHVHGAHARASAALLRLLLGQAELASWLRSLKHFFLLDQGDVVVHLAEAARAELVGPAAGLPRPRLQSLLEMAVRTSSLAQDVHADSLVLELDPRPLLGIAETMGLVRQLPSGGGALQEGERAWAAGAAAADVAGWQVVQLSVSLAWPLTLAVPPRAMAHYQLIFKYLFQLKHAERQLAVAWQRMQSARTASKAGRTGLRPAYVLAHRYLFCIQEVLRYCTMDVLEPTWQAMEEGVRKAADVDQVIACHEAFLARAVDGLLLSYPQLLRPLVALQQGAITFASRMQQAWDIAEALHQQQHAAQGFPGGAGSGSLRNSPLVPSSEAELDMDDVAEAFSARLAELLEGLQELYVTAMRREAGGGSEQTGPQPQSLDTREEVEALLNLIQRLQLEQAGGWVPGPGVSGGAAGMASSAALYKQLAAAAAALQQ